MPTTQKNQSKPVSDLAARFKQATNSSQMIDEEKEYEKIQQMTLEELSKECISFGTTYVGKPFPSLMGETRYVTWFVNMYQHSHRPSHAKFIRYIQLYVEDLENNPLQAKAKSCPKAKGKSQPKGYYAEQSVAPQGAPTLSSEEEEEFDPMDPLPAGSWEQVEPVPNLEMQELRERMHKMEDVMQQVLHHLSQPTNQAAK